MEHHRIIHKINASNKITAMREATVENLKMAKTYVDDSAANQAAENVVCDFLKQLGFDDVVEAFRDVKYWKH